jgi:hypothetical protein
MFQVGNERKMNEGNRQTGEHRYKCEEKIKNNLKGIRCEGGDWFCLAQDRPINGLM